MPCCSLWRKLPSTLILWNPSIEDIVCIIYRFWNWFVTHPEYRPTPGSRGRRPNDIKGLKKGFQKSGKGWKALDSETSHVNFSILLPAKAAEAPNYLPWNGDPSVHEVCLESGRLTRLTATCMYKLLPTFFSLTPTGYFRILMDISRLSAMPGLCS